MKLEDSQNLNTAPIGEVEGRGFQFRLSGSRGWGTQSRTNAFAELSCRFASFSSLLQPGSSLTITTLPLV